MVPGRVCFLVVLAAIFVFCGVGSDARAQEGDTGTVIYTAFMVITMDEAMPEAAAVAVADGGITAVGSLEDVRRSLGDQAYHVDETFEGNLYPVSKN